MGCLHHAVHVHLHLTCLMLQSQGAVDVAPHAQEAVHIKVIGGDVCILADAEGLLAGPCTGMDGVEHQACAGVTGLQARGIIVAFMMAERRCFGMRAVCHYNTLDAGIMRVWHILEAGPAPDLAC